MASLRAYIQLSNPDRAVISSHDDSSLNYLLGIVNMAEGMLAEKGKLSEKTVFKHLYSHLYLHNLIAKNQSDFFPGDSPTKSLEVRAIFLDISKAFNKV